MAKVRAPGDRPLHAHTPPTHNTRAHAHTKHTRACAHTHVPTSALARARMHAQARSYRRMMRTPTYVHPRTPAGQGARGVASSSWRPAICGPGPGACRCLRSPQGQSKRSPTAWAWRVRNAVRSHARRVGPKRGKGGRPSGGRHLFPTLTTLSFSFIIFLYFFLTFYDFHTSPYYRKYRSK